MILVNPLPLQPVNVFVRYKATIYNVTVTNQATKKVESFDVPFDDLTIVFDGSINFKLPITLVKNTFYALIMRDNTNRISNYSVIYCAENLTQNYKRIDEMFTQPVKDKIQYDIPVKT